MNLTELLFVGLIVVGVVVLSSFLGETIGVSPWLVAPVASMFAFGFMYWLMDVLDTRLRDNVNPSCENGSCDSYDYELELNETLGAILICKCGKRYRKNGLRVFEKIDESGISMPYKEKKFIRGWVDDHRLGESD